MLDQLKSALAAVDLVRIERRHFDARDRVSHGIPVAMTDTLVLYSLLSHQITLDGYEVVRVADITSCAAAYEHKAFYSRALALKRLSPVHPPDLDLASMPALLVSAQRKFPLLTIHRELLYPGECDIGRLKLTSNEAFAIHYIDPSARWRDEPGHYRFSDVTRVNFGGEYEATLALVAESPPRS